MPVGVADIEQPRPASHVVDGDAVCRVKGKQLDHPLRIAENGGGVQAVTGYVGRSFEDRGGLTHTALDRGGHEDLGQPLGGCGVGLDGGLELRPAREAQLAGNDQLGDRQADLAGGGRWAVVAAETLDGVGVAAAGGVAQLLGLASQLVEVGALRKRSGHGVSLLRLRSAAQAEEEATAMTVRTTEVDSVLPADPAAPSRCQPPS